MSLSSLHRLAVGFPIASVLIRRLPGWACLWAGMAASAWGVFSDPNFVEEEVYRGNGMISMAFDGEGRLYVTEKQGRLLLFEPNNMPAVPITYQYFEGEWNALPDFDALSPVATGTVEGFTLEPRLRDDNFAIRYTATLTVAEAGDYTFYTTSDDGSRLSVDGVEVVDNDGAHGNIEESGQITLTAGEHNVVVEYFEAGGGESLTVEWEGPGIVRQTLGGAASDFSPPGVVADLRTEVNTDGERGLARPWALGPGLRQQPLCLICFTPPTRTKRLVRITLDETFHGHDARARKSSCSMACRTSTAVHNAGDIHFHPDDPFTLYVMLGDDGDRFLVDDLDLYNGKLLRVDAATGEGLSDNPLLGRRPGFGALAHLGAQFSQRLSLRLRSGRAHSGLWSIFRKTATAPTGSCALKKAPTEAGPDTFTEGLVGWQAAHPAHHGSLRHGASSSCVAAPSAPDRSGHLPSPVRR